MIPPRTTAEAQSLTRAEFKAKFMSMTYGQWHLYATATGVTIAPEGEHMVRLVSNVHAMDLPRALASLQAQLERSWPSLWDLRLPRYFGPEEWQRVVGLARMAKAGAYHGRAAANMLRNVAHQIESGCVVPVVPQI